MNKIKKIVALILESLTGKNPEDTDAFVYEKDILKAGLNIQQAEMTFKQLIRDGIIIERWHVMYEANKPRPTKLAIQMHRVSLPDNIYDVPVYVFSVNRAKLNIHNLKQGEGIFYQVQKNMQGIFVNEFQISKPHLLGDNVTAFDLFNENPDRLIKPSELAFSKHLTKIVSELGFTGDLKKAFFPNVSNKKGLIFRNQISTTQFAEENIDKSGFLKILKKRNRIFQNK